MSLEERLVKVQKELQALEEHLKEQADYKKQYEELVAVTENRLNAAQLETDELKRRLQGSEKWVEEFKQQGVQFAEEKETLLRKLSEANASTLAFKNLLRPIITELIEEQFTDALKKMLGESVEPLSREVAVKVMEDLRKGDIPQELAHKVIEVLSTQEVKIPRPLADYWVDVDRSSLKCDPSTVRGKLLLLIMDGLFDKNQSIPKVIMELNNQYPLTKVDRNQVEAEINYFVEQQVLRHVTPDPTHHYYVLRPEAKGRLHLTEKVV